MLDFIKNIFRSTYTIEDDTITCGWVKFNDVDAETVIGYIENATKVEATLGRLTVYYKDGICWDGTLHLSEYFPVPKYLQRRMMTSKIQLPPYCITPRNIHNSIHLDVHISRSALIELNPPDGHESPKNKKKPEKHDQSLKRRNQKRIINIKE